MKLPSNMLRAAMHCQASGDVRYYLNGIHIKDKFIEATNGHVAVRMTMDKSCKKDLIIYFKQKIPAKVVSTKISITKTESIAKHYCVSGELISISVIDIVSGKFPDVGKVIQKEVKATEFIGVNPNHVALWSKMFKEKFPTAKMTFNGKDNQIKMTSTSDHCNYEYGDPILIIMPTRIPSKKRIQK